MQELQPKSETSCWGARHTQILLGSLYITLCIITRADISVTIIPMTSREFANSKYPVRLWSEKEKGYVLSVFYLGYLITQISGGSWAEKNGPKPIMFWSMVFIGLFAFLTFPAVYFFSDWIPLLIVRFLLGVAQGVSFPAFNCFLAKWMPPQEKTMLYPLAFLGTQGGIFIGVLLGGILSSNFGWPSVFCTSAFLAMIWCTLWAFYGCNDPGEHAAKIIPEERKLIGVSQNTRQLSRKEVSDNTPWRSILTCKHYWCAVAAQLAACCGSVFVMLEIPSYLFAVLKLNILRNGLVLASIYMLAGIFMLLCAAISHYIGVCGIMTLTHQRKLWSCIDLCGMSGAMLALIFVTIDKPEKAIVLIAAAIIATSPAYCGFFASFNDMSPNYVGTITGISNVIGNAGSLLVPFVTGYIVQDPQDVSQWNIAFILVSMTMLASCIVYLLYGTAEEQEWNIPEAIRHKNCLLPKSGNVDVEKSLNN